MEVLETDMANHQIHLLKDGRLLYTDFIVESDKRVKRSWNYDPSSRGNAYDILIKALNEGANKQQIDEVCKQWNITNDDAKVFARKAGMEVHESRDGFIAYWQSNTSARTLPKSTVFEAIAKLAGRYSKLYEYNLKDNQVL